MVFNATFNNISFTSWRSLLLWTSRRANQEFLRTTLLRNISDSTYFSQYGLESADFIGVSGGVIRGSIGETNDISNGSSFASVLISFDFKCILLSCSGKSEEKK